MTKRVDDHLEFEKICWMATIERDPNELIELSLRMCELMDRRKSLHGDTESAAHEEMPLPVSNERGAEA